MRQPIAALPAAALLLGALLLPAAPGQAQTGVGTPSVGQPGLAVPGGAGAGQPTTDFRRPPPRRLPPGIASITGGTLPIQRGRAFQFYVTTQLRIDFRGLAPGEVRITLRSLPAGDEPASTRTPRCRFLPFSGASFAPAVPDANGNAFTIFTGAFVTDLRLVDQPGTCRFQATVDRRQPDLNYATEATFTSAEIPIWPHEEVRITDTARLRADFLRPVASPDCQADDRDNQFGQRITARARPSGCRTDLLPAREGWPQQQLGALRPGLAEGVILKSVRWRLEGDTGTCGLCPNPLQACRGPNQVLGEYARLLTGGGINWLYRPPIAAYLDRPMEGAFLSVFAGPPRLPNREPVRVDTRSEYQDTSLLEFVERLDQAGRAPHDVIGEGAGQWQSWMRPFSTRLDCEPWAPPPPPASAVAGALGGVVRGQSLPAPPPAPTLRLVLTEATFLRPTGRRVPGD